VITVINREKRITARCRAYLIIIIDLLFVCYIRHPARLFRHSGFFKKAGGTPGRLDGRSCYQQGEKSGSPFF
jgi:hypothetical protein